VIFLVELVAADLFFVAKFTALSVPTSLSSPALLALLPISLVSPSQLLALRSFLLATLTQSHSSEAGAPVHRIYPWALRMSS
jgi:hypothetical protein